MLTGPFNLSQTRELLAALGHSPKKWLGQNFLIDGNIVKKSLDLAAVAAGDIIVEVGPGLGTLTTTLLQAGARVFAVERDATMAAHLRERVLPAYPEKFSLLEGDAMDYPLAAFPQTMPAGTAFKIVANLPYAISTPWMDAVLDFEDLPTTLVLMLQKEAADRFTGLPGTKNYGALSVFLDAVYERAPGHNVSAKCFFPPPKIDSCLLHLRLKASPQKFVPAAKKMIREIFIYRRKQLGAALKQISLPPGVVPATLETWLERLPQFSCARTDRPENIVPAAWQDLNSLIKNAWKI
ncbi:MAG: 16S rRNA (adenine(1518)-N(6)/adenine(1519)-N(6))-dimethyltransferase RsmA [Opitutales bacterium]|nr:16S rRNA (adenine(1518)-N(6)/adenine(1519)-N(6))-dimethyltransferase RsmA [Opitutales bacterium]